MDDWPTVLLGLVLVFFVVVLPLFYLGNLLIRGLQALDRRAEGRNRERLVGEMLRPEEKPERAFLKACTNCRAFSITLPHRDRLGRTYCSEPCLEWLDEGGGISVSVARRRPSRSKPAI